MNPNELRRLAAEKIKAAGALLSAAGPDGLSDEDKMKWEGLHAEAKKLQGQADMLDAQASSESALTQSTGRVVIGNPRERIEDKPWESFGEHVRAIINFYRGVERDPRLHLAASGASESVPSDGGILVDQQYAPGIQSRIYDSGVIASRCARTQIGENANGLKINGVDESSRATGSRYGGVRGYWIGEADAITASKPKFEQIEIGLRKLAALYYATDELLQDTTALGAIVDRAMTDEMSFLLDDAILNGSGAVKPLGILNCGALISVAVEGGQAATTFKYENAVKMRARLWARSRPNAVWLMNQDVDPQLLVMSLAVGTGGAPVYLPARGAADQPYDTLLGIPILFVEQCQTLGTIGDVVLADLSQYQLIEKGGVQQALSIHVQFVNDEIVMRWIMRVNGKPLWTSALTPAHGSNSVGPFIALAR